MLFPLFHHLLTNAFVLAHEGEKNMQKNNRAYTDIAPVKEEDQVSFWLCCK